MSRGVKTSLQYTNSKRIYKENENNCTQGPSPYLFLYYLLLWCGEHGREQFQKEKSSFNNKEKAISIANYYPQFQEEFAPSSFSLREASLRASILQFQPLGTDHKTQSSESLSYMRNGSVTIPIPCSDLFFSLFGSDLPPPSRNWFVLLQESHSEPDSELFSSRTTATA
jgi:hypothetical protein